ncbi:MAG: ABC transporter permease [Alphaproteobacteria bacterium]
MRHLRHLRPRRLREPFSYARHPGFVFFFALTILFLYLPIIVLVVFSFNDSRRNIVWRGFTWDYYGKAIGNNDLMQSFANSILIALFSTAISLTLGALLAVLLWRFRFVGKPVVEALSALPIVMPEICVGISLLVFFSAIGWPTNLPWPLNLSNIILAHVTFTFPFVMLVVRARLVGFNLELEQAARDLGASGGQAFRHILIPYMRPGLVAGGLLAITLSLDDFVITFFTAGPESSTFPIKIYSLLKRGVSPDINAASTMLIVLTVVLASLGLFLQARGQRREVVEAKRVGE